MKSSLWESKWFYEADTIIIGSGIVGLSCASAILEAQPTHRVLILERGLIPTGASTRNAGIASFGTFIEILDDIEKLGEREAFNSIKIMHESLMTLRRRVGDENLDFKQYGGYDIITEDLLPRLDKVKYVNDLLRPIFGDDVISITNEKIEEFGFNKSIVKALVFNKYEGQIDSGKGIINFQKHVQKLGARLITGAEVIGHKKDKNGDIIVDVKDPLVEGGVMQFRSQNLVMCTDFHSGKLIKDLDIYPVRGQIVLTKPIPGLKMKGTFLYHSGYFYIRDYYGRILIGGGTIPFLQEESVSDPNTTEKIIGNIHKVLKDVLLPGKEYKTEHEWAGIMCYGKELFDSPIVKKLEDNVYAAIRMGGYGVTRCSLVADQIRNLVLADHKIKPKL